MKRLVVNAFCPAEHKVISPELANPDLPPGATELISDGQGSSLLAIWIKIHEVRTASSGQFGHFGLWLSLVERLVRDQEAVGSNPTSPILITAR